MATIRMAHVATGFKRRLWGGWLQLRFRLFQRHRYDRLALETIGGKPFVVLPQVFNPGLFDTSRLLARALSARLLPPGSTVLDMGTGSGIAAVFAAQWAGRIVAVDINPAAVRCARINALLNQVEDRVEVLQGDLFEPVRGRRFDVVLFNPPFYRGAPRDALDRAWRSTDTVERFAAELRQYLTPAGRAIIVLSTQGETPAFMSAFQSNGLTVETLLERDLVSEVVTLYRLAP